MELLQLNDHNRKASLGRNYPELNIVYPHWSRDLHAEGNFINNKKLATISINGLIRWYFKELSHFNIDYNFKNIETFIDSPEYITFYDIKVINNLGKYFSINNEYLSNIDFDIYNYKFEYFFSKYNYTFSEKNRYNMNTINKYNDCKFGRYLIDKIGIDILKEYLISIYTEYLKFQEFFNGKSLFNNFLQLYPKIIDWGIIYHKFKVILEKLSRNSHKDIYIVDKFVETIQQYIFTLISKHCENILLNKNNDIYIKDEENLYKDQYFQPFPDSILKDYDFTTIL